MKRTLAIMAATIVAALSVTTAKADAAYLHAVNAASTCWTAVYPSAAANLRPYGIKTWTYNWTRTNDTSLQIRINAFGNIGTFVGGDGNTYFYIDLLACRVVGNDPGTVTAISDWGTTWRNIYQLG